MNGIYVNLLYFFFFLFFRWTIFDLFDGFKFSSTEFTCRNIPLSPVSIFSLHLLIFRLMEINFISHFFRSIPSTFWPKVCACAMQVLRSRTHFICENRSCKTCSSFLLFWYWYINCMKQISLYTIRINKPNKNKYN